MVKFRFSDKLFVIGFILLTFLVPFVMPALATGGILCCSGGLFVLM